MIDKEVYYKYLIEKDEKIINNISDKELINHLKEEIKFLKEKL